MMAKRKTKTSYKKSYKTKRKKNILKSKFFWIIVFLIILLIGLFYLINFFPFFQINNIKIFGNEEVPSEEIERVVQTKINKQVVFIQSKSILTADLKSIGNDILNGFPKVFTVEIKRQFPKTLIFEIRERDPLANWCNFDKCFYLDINGVIFRESNWNEEILTIISEGEKELKLKDIVIEKKLLEKIILIQKYLEEEREIKIKEIVISIGKTTIKTEEGWEAYFNLKGDVDWQIEKLRAVMEKEIIDRSDLEYIELRFGNLAPYK